MTELLPCPFCGGEAVITDCVYHLKCEDGGVYDKKGWTVGCRTVGCRGWFNRSINTEAEAVKAWNTRAGAHCAFAQPTDLTDGCALLAERTCHIVAYENPICMDDRYFVELSCGHCFEWDEIVDGDKPNFCPQCGAKVIP